MVVGIHANTTSTIKIIAIKHYPKVGTLLMIDDDRNARVHYPCPSANSFAGFARLPLNQKKTVDRARMQIIPDPALSSPSCSFVPGLLLKKEKEKRTNQPTTHRRGS